MKDSDFHSNTPGIRSWIFVFLAGIFCLVVFVFLSPQHDFSLFTFTNNDEAQIEEGVSQKNISQKKGKKRRKKRRGKKRKKGLKDSVNLDDDYVYNDIEFGEVGEEIAERDPEIQKLAPLPPPPKSLWNPSSSYRPSARYSESGRTRKFQTSVDFEKSGSSKKLSSSQIRAKLNTRLVISCYNSAVNRAPKMRGKVSLKGTIEKDGHISFVKITRSKINSRVVEKCIVNKVKKVRFSRISQAMTFSTSFTFSSR